MGWLDAANYVHLNKMQANNAYDDAIDELNDMAAGLSDRYGVHVKRFGEFMREQPEPQEKGSFWGTTLIVFGLALAATSVVGAVAGVALAAEFAPEIIRLAFFGIGTGLGLTIFGDAIADREHDYRGDDLVTYRKYILETEKTLQVAESKGLIKARSSSLSIEEQIAQLAQRQQSPTHFQDMVTASREQALQTETARG